MRTVGDALSWHEARLFVGRQRELATFRRWLEADERAPTILNVSGPPGVGKSSLLGAFLRHARSSNRPTFLVDGRTFRPASEAFVHALGGHDLEALIRDLNANFPL